MLLLLHQVHFSPVGDGEHRRLRVECAVRVHHKVGDLGFDSAPCRREREIVVAAILCTNTPDIPRISLSPTPILRESDGEEEEDLV